MSDGRRPRLRWLHVSDLHVKADDPYAQDQVLSALLRSFGAGEPLADLRPDVVFCTGDIAHGGKPEQYEEAIRFFDALCTATGVSRKNIMVVPGNHDLNRGAVSRRFRLELESREDADEFFGPSADAREDRELAWRRFAAYADFHGKMFDAAPDAARPYSVWRTAVGGCRLGVIGLNTAWLALEGANPRDLVMGERVVDEALDAVSADEPPDLVVALLHHPLEWLAEFERQRVEERLFERCDLVLYGHLHAERPWGVQTPEGRRVGLLGAGATYQTRRWPNTAQIGELRGRTIGLQGIRFIDRRRGVWAPDRELAPKTDGRMTFELTPRPARKPAAAPAPRPTSGEFDRDRYLRHVEGACGAIYLTGLLRERANAHIPLEAVYAAAGILAG